MTAVNFYIFRHGQTDWNAERKCQGHTDIPLNDLGRFQAQRLSEKLKDIEIDLIVSSDLMRARETAKIAFTGREIPIQFEEDLREIHLGKFEGSLWDDMERELGTDEFNRYLSFKKEDLSFRFPEGESKQEQLDRITSCLHKYSQEGHNSIAVSFHGGSLVRLIHHCEDLQEDIRSVGNCALFKLSYLNGKWNFISEI